MVHEDKCEDPKDGDLFLIRAKSQKILVQARVDQ